MSDSTRITVNGVDYDSVDAMPAEVRRVYEQMRANFRDLAQGGREVAPEVFHRDVGPVHFTTTIRKVVANGKRVSETSMNETFEHAAPETKSSEIKLTFDVTSPHFTFRKTWGGASRLPSPAGLVASESSSGMPSPTPIEPSAEGRVRTALALGACAVIALAVWLLTKMR